MNSNIWQLGLKLK